MELRTSTRHRAARESRTQRRRRDRPGPRFSLRRSRRVRRSAPRCASPTVGYGAQRQLEPALRPRALPDGRAAALVALGVAPTPARTRLWLCLPPAGRCPGAPGGLRVARFVEWRAAGEAEGPCCSPAASSGTARCTRFRARADPRQPSNPGIPSGSGAPRSRSPSRRSKVTATGAPAGPAHALPGDATAPMDQAVVERGRRVTHLVLRSRLIESRFPRRPYGAGLPEIKQATRRTRRHLQQRPRLREQADRRASRWLRRAPIFTVPSRPTTWCWWLPRTPTRT